jgi:hypothetical protein
MTPLPTHGDLAASYPATQRAGSWDTRPGARVGTTCTMCIRCASRRRMRLPPLFADIPPPQASSLSETN